jgi:hypothetical protein
MMPIYGAAVVAVVLLGVATVIGAPHARLSLALKCPRCGSCTQLRRVPRNFGDRVLSLVIGFRKYRCASCNWTGLFRERAGGPQTGTSGSSEYDLPTLQDQRAPARQIDRHTKGTT